MKYIKLFRDITLDDIGLVGGKNASLGEMIHSLTALDVRVPDGFALTADAYWHHIKANNLEQRMRELLARVKQDSGLATLQTTATALRKLIADAPLPSDIEQALYKAYHDLSRAYDVDTVSVAVRSSATAEDLPTASFAGQQETFLHIRGDKELVEACKKCMASLFTERAMIYRREKGFDDMAIALSVGVQKMVNADNASAGVLFTLDTETGFADVVMINGSYGLGELMVQGRIIPDEWYVHKPTLAKGFRPIIKKILGTKPIKLVSKNGSQQEVAVGSADQVRFSLTDDEVLELARLGVVIEKHYSNRAGHWVPMDIEWAKDSDDGMLYIVQARPETVHAHDQKNMLEEYVIEGDISPTVLIKGQSIGKKIATGVVRVVESLNHSTVFNAGDILVTRMTDPDWLPLLKKAGGVVTDIGGRTCHAAIVSRELGIPAIIGTHDATKRLTTGQDITLDCSKGVTGFVYEGRLPFAKKRIDSEKLPKSSCDILINLADPDRAFGFSFLPVQGVGLARLEFIMLNIGVHPMAAALWDQLHDNDLRSELLKRAAGYANPREFFVSLLAQGIATIAAAFYPHQVVVRLSDFKTNEYKDLLGGVLFEAEEENPMLGFRGAVRYSSDHYAPAFTLECEAVKRVREEMGLQNVVVMIPFVRTVEEARGALKAMAKHGLERDQKGLRIFMMVEIPSNVILIDQFAPLFDGFSIGSNDLTQLTLGVDRDSGILAHLFDERDPAVQKMLLLAIAGAHKAGKYISICGQAPSDFPELADLLIQHGIDALSLNPDAVIPFLLRKAT